MEAQAIQSYWKLFTCFDGVIINGRLHLCLQREINPGRGVAAKQSWLPTSRRQWNAQEETKGYAYFYMWKADISWFAKLFEKRARVHYFCKCSLLPLHQKKQQRDNSFNLLVHVENIYGFESCQRCLTSAAKNKSRLSERIVPISSVKFTLT